VSNTFLDWQSFEDKYSVDEESKMQAHEARTPKGVYSVYDSSDEGVYDIFYCDSEKEKRVGSDVARIKVGSYASLEGAKKLAESHEARSKMTVPNDNR